MMKFFLNTPSVRFADTSPINGGGVALRLRQALSSPVYGGSTVPDLIRDGDGGE